MMKIGDDYILYNVSVIDEYDGNTHPEYLCVPFDTSLNQAVEIAHKIFAPDPVVGITLVSRPTYIVQKDD